MASLSTPEIQMEIVVVKPHKEQDGEIDCGHKEYIF